MELKIEIDETKFKDIIEKELNAFSQEELHDLLKQMIVEYMKNHQEEVMNLFIRKKNSGYYGYDEWIAGPLLEKASDCLNVAEDIKPVKDAIVKDLSEHHRDIVERAIWKNITMSMAHDPIFIDEIANTVSNHLTKSQY